MVSLEKLKESKNYFDEFVAMCVIHLSFLIISNKIKIKYKKNKVKKKCYLYLPNKDDRSFQLLGWVAAGWVAGGWVFLVVGVGPIKCTRVMFWDRLRSCADAHDHLWNLLKKWPRWGPKKRFCPRLVLTSFDEMCK